MLPTVDAHAAGVHPSTARDSHGFALGMHGGYRNPITQREWKWFVAGAGVAVPPLVDNQRRLLDALQNLCDVQGIEALALPAVLAARNLIASASSPHDQGAAACTAGVKRMDNPYWRKGSLFSESAARAVVTLEQSRLDEFLALAAGSSVPATTLGRVGGDRLCVEFVGAAGTGMRAGAGAWRRLDVGVDALRAAYEEAIPCAMQG